MKRTCLLGAVLIAVGLSGCSSKPAKDGATTDGDATTPKTIRVDGSSTVAPVTELAAEEFQKAIWGKEAEGKATRRSDVRPGWPAEKIELFGPGRDSGTFDYFTEAITGKAGDSRTDYTASEDDNRLVRGVAGNKFALGYFGFAYLAAHKVKLSAVKIKGPGAKEAVEPGAAGIRDGSYTPLSRPLFVYVNQKSAERPEVARFVTFLLEQAPSLTGRKKYVPLTTQAYVLMAKRFEQRRTGSAFDGKPAVGLSMDAIVNRELR